MHCGLPGEGFDVTEAGTQKRLAVGWCATRRMWSGSPRSAPTHSASAANASVRSWAARGHGSRICSPTSGSLPGIGNAYSDEILHVAGLSPFATSNTPDETKVDGLYAAMRLVLTDAVTRLDEASVATMKAEKRTGLRVHARTGLPCPECDDTVREVAFADRSFQYCPKCQTGGKIPADRGMSWLLK